MNMVCYVHGLFRVVYFEQVYFKRTLNKVALEAKAN